MGLVPEGHGSTVMFHYNGTRGDPKLFGSVVTYVQEQISEQLFNN